jgi:hypothetical protein
MQTFSFGHNDSSCLNSFSFLQSRPKINSLRPSSVGPYELHVMAADEIGIVCLPAHVVAATIAKKTLAVNTPNDKI